jgi:hypothetical protein
MFWIMQDPSSGSDIQYLAKITNIGSIVQVITEFVSVMAAQVFLGFPVSISKC